MLFIAKPSKFITFWERKEMEITKRDWKLFRNKVADWQEKYMEGLCKEYVELLSKEGIASDKFWKMDDHVITFVDLDELVMM